jgi:hypothetical protein
MGRDQVEGVLKLLGRDGSRMHPRLPLLGLAGLLLGELAVGGGIEKSTLLGWV